MLYVRSTRNVHLTQIVNNKMLKVDLCEACASEKGLIGAQVQQGFALADILDKHTCTLIILRNQILIAWTVDLIFRPSQPWPLRL